LKAATASTGAPCIAGDKRPILAGWLRRIIRALPHAVAKFAVAVAADAYTRPRNNARRFMSAGPARRVLESL
jgi:hypothetical protein